MSSVCVYVVWEGSRIKREGVGERKEMAEGEVGEWLQQLHEFSIHHNFSLFYLFGIPYFVMMMIGIPRICRLLKLQRAIYEKSLLSQNSREEKFRPLAYFKVISLP